MASMHLQHAKNRIPWILLPIVSGPWTSFVAALDKGQCSKAVCRRHSTLTSFFKDKKSKESHKTAGIKVFLPFCLMIEGSGSVPLTNRSGSGSRRHKTYLRIRRICNSLQKLPPGSKYVTVVVCRRFEKLPRIGWLPGTSMYHLQEPLVWVLKVIKLL
jgi:hypothetical protein